MPIVSKEVKYKELFHWMSWTSKAQPLLWRNGCESTARMIHRGYKVMKDLYYVLV